MARRIFVFPITQTPGTLCAGLPTPHTPDRRSPEAQEIIAPAFGDLRSGFRRGRETFAERACAERGESQSRSHAPARKRNVQPLCGEWHVTQSVEIVPLLVFGHAGHGNKEYVQKNGTYTSLLSDLALFSGPLFSSAEHRTQDPGAAAR